jgi:putative endonuclease
MDPSPVRRGAHSVSRGRHFERVAERHLLARGFEPIARNVRFGHGEIDLVMRDGEVVVFVEVKGRSGDRCGHPLDAVTRRKRQEVEAVARWWIRSHEPAQGYRFDAVAVEAQGKETRDWSVTHVPDAWRPGG